MFAKIKRLIGNITVEVKKNIVYVEGVPADVIAKDIKRVWGTSKIATNLFNEIDNNSFSFEEFFCIDILYVLDRMIEDRSSNSHIRSLTKIKEQLLLNTWLADTQKEYPSKMDYSKLKDFHYTPFDFQQGFFEHYDQITQQYGLRGLLLAATAGSGKSLSSLMMLHCMDIEQVVIVSPKNALHRVWETTIQTGFKEKQDYWVVGSNNDFTGKEKYIIVNYEYLGKLLKEVDKLKSKKIAVILDESHNFNTHDSLRTTSFVELCKVVNSKEVLWLSGTPIKALSTEAIPLFRTIDPKFNEDVEQRFKKIFGVSSERATDILKNRLGFTSFKVEKKELNILPPIFKEIKVSIPNADKYTLASISKAMYLYTQERIAYYKSRSADDNAFFNKCLSIYQRTLRDAKSFQEYEYYQKCLKIVIRTGGDSRVAKEEVLFCNKYENLKVIPTLPKELKAPFKDVKSIIKYVGLKIQGECLGRIVGRARIDAHIDMCDHIDYIGVMETTPKKTVVFTSFVQVIEKLQEYLPTLGLEPSFVYAKTNSQLSKILEEYDSNENKDPLVATYASLSTAVPILSADKMILIDSPFRDYVLQQTVSRISRIGATTQTYIYTASLDTGDAPNISSRSFDILKWSQQSVEAILGIRSPFEISDDLEQANLALEGLLEPEVIPIGTIPNYLDW